jgi:uncharacterized protein (DUF433 family)
MICGAMSQAVEIGSLIERSPEIHGGRPRIAGTGVTVMRIIGWYQQRQTPQEIVTQLPQLTLAHVFAALTYYHANRDEIDADLAQDQGEADRLEEYHRVRDAESTTHHYS